MKKTKISDIKNVSALKAQWLNSRGGRTFQDVFKDEQCREFIYVSKHGKDVKSFIPVGEGLFPKNWL